METILLISLILLILINAIAIVNVIAGPLQRSYSSPTTTPLVSVLVPARNEERNLSACLEYLSQQSYPHLEIRVLNDHSVDGTLAIARKAAEHDPRITIIAGEELPEGWTGKNWACYQLSRRATGQIMLFVDADVRARRGAIESLVAMLERFHADAATAFPQQALSGIFAKAVIPIMDVLLYGALPLRLVRVKAFPSLSAANGQWIAFRREAYEAIGTHSAVRMNIVEDVALARRVKEQKMRLVVASGVGSVDCAMYDGLPEIVEGFSKNFFAAFNFRLLAFIPVLLLLALLFVLPFVMLLVDIAPIVIGLVALNFSLRGMLALRFRHGVASVFLHPFGVVIALAIGLNAIRLYYHRKGVFWKGRMISVRTPS